MAGILELQRLAGNQATSLVLQRNGPDASKGERWNDGRAYQVGKIWRVMVAGLKGGEKGRWRGGESHHTDEPADHRAVVLVPEGFEPEQPAEVLVYFHGHTEAKRREYAGWRQRHFTPTRDETRRGFASDDTVRDVALDQIEQQIQGSGRVQMIGILPQGGPQHQFGDIAGDDYIRDVLEKASAAHPDVLKSVPASWKVVLSGHSGGGFEVANQLAGKPGITALEAIVLFDANDMRGEIARRLREDLDALGDVTKTDAERGAQLALRPAVRVFARNEEPYGPMYATLVDDTITAWMRRHQLSAAQKTELGRLHARDACTDAPGQPACRALSVRERSRMDQLDRRAASAEAVTRFLPQLHRVYQVTVVDPDTVQHEELIRGAKTGDVQHVDGDGNLKKALQSLP